VKEILHKAQVAARRNEILSFAQTINAAIIVGIFAIMLMERCRLASWERWRPAGVVMSSLPKLRVFHTEKTHRRPQTRPSDAPCAGISE